MSTNQEIYLKDESGNRRWLPVAIKQVVNTEWLEENRDQLFAEAYHRVVVLKESTYEFPAEEMERQQGLRQIADPNEAIIFEWYYNVLTDEQRAFGVTTRNAYLGAINGGFGGGRQMEKRDDMTISSILLHGLKLQRRRSMVKGTRESLYCPTKESEANKPDSSVIPTKVTKSLDF